MAKKKGKPTDPAEERAGRIKRTEAYANRIRLMFVSTVNQILALNKTIPKLNPGEMFSFDAQSLKKQKEVERLLRQLHSVATVAIQQGVTLEWAQANAAADQLVRSVFGQEVLSSPEFNGWTQRNGAARDAFLARSERGLNLSDRVWRAVKQLREEMEVAITISVGEGESAQKLSQNVRQYLQDPDLMFRRFRYKAGEEIKYDEDGNEIGKKIIWGKKWKKKIRKPDGTVGWIDYDRDSYKTGAGVYKSSYKNAMRVARTETNIAYRRADQERWSQMDFVLGQRVELSKDHPKKDICDKLAGDYPVDFKFDGWHPQCFCFVVPITIPPEETEHLTEMMLNGEDWRAELQRLRRGRVITSYPANFTQWVKDNAENIINAHDIGTDPYFVRNNFGVINSILHPKKALTPKEIAEQRHAARTPEQEDAIRRRWQEHNARIDTERHRDERIKSTAKNILKVANSRFAGLGIDTSTLEAAVKKGDPAVINNEMRTLAQALSKRQQQVKQTANNVMWVASRYKDIGSDALTSLSDLVKTGDVSAINTQTRALAQQVANIRNEIKALSSLIPNPMQYADQYTVVELQTAHKEFDGVMQKWLRKYGYSSLEDAPLEHLRNKLDFELTNPTISYSQKEIIKKAITERIDAINKKIAWNNLVSKASTLKTFKTKSSIFKSYLAQIDDAIRNNDFTALQNSITAAELQQQKLVAAKIKRGGTSGALNTEYKGGASGNDISSSVDVSTMTSADPYRHTFTNNIARMQGFDAPAKLVSESEFDLLEKACGEVFYRTVNPTKFKGKNLSSAEFAAQLYTADLMELNGPGGRVYGDGMYVATSAWNGSKIRTLSDSYKQEGYNDSICYGNGRHTISEMTWTRIPRVILQTDLHKIWNKLNSAQRQKFGNHPNTYACALGYDAMYCDGVNYMVIWNRSIIAVKKK